MRPMLTLVPLLLAGCAKNHSVPDYVMPLSGVAIIGATAAVPFMADETTAGGCLAEAIAPDIGYPVGMALIMGEEGVPALEVSWCDCSEAFELATFAGLPDQVVAVGVAALEAKLPITTCEGAAWARGIQDAAAHIAPTINEAIQGGTCVVTTIDIAPDWTVGQCDG